MSHSVKRPKSKYEQFRMNVPEDVRAVVGKTAWTESLGTTDPLLAQELRAKLVAKHTAEIRSIRAGNERRAHEAAVAMLHRAFSRLALLRDSMDTAVAEQLSLLGSFVRDSWAGTDQTEQRQWWGDICLPEPTIEVEAVPSIDTEPERDTFRLRAELLEGRGIADGLVYQELARVLLVRRTFRPIWSVVSYMRSIEPGLDLEESYDAVADAYLRRLAEHEFACWPANIRAALAPVSLPEPVAVPVPPTVASVPPAPAAAGVHHGLLAMRLTEARRYWQEHRRPQASAVIEATRAVSRFVALFGDQAVGDITRDQIVEFRNLIADLPPQTELSKLEKSGRTLRDAINAARDERRAWEKADRSTPEPDRLAPGTVKKDVGALSQILGKVAADRGNGVNVAAKIEIAGYSKKRKGQKTPRLPFTPEMMQALFDSPLFTGCAGRSDAARVRAGSHVFQDEMYWSFLFGVVGGPRLGEIGQIALSDVHRCDLRRTFGDDYEGSCTFIHITGTGEGQHVKNDESDRYVVIHDRLIALGFNDYVQQRRAADAARLFDLRADEDGKYTKELSRRLNRYLDRVVTDDPRYVFHSTRHEFTDRANLSEIPTRVANSIKGHANTSVADEYGLVSILNQYVHLKKLRVGFIDWSRLIEAARALEIRDDVRP